MAFESLTDRLAGVFKKLLFSLSVQNEEIPYKNS